MEKIKVLFVDDDVALGNLVVLTLNDMGYDAYYQSSLIAIKTVIAEIKPNIIVLDVEIGQKNGIDEVPEIRAVDKKVPILFISSHLEADTVVRAINMGGIAYLKKPFEVQELLAYISRHVSEPEIKRLKFGHYTLDIDENALYHDDVIIKRLSLTEYKLLSLLVLNINVIVKRVDIIKILTNETYYSEHSLNNFISKLRKYISNDKKLEIITMSKVGYKLISKIK